MENLKPPRGKQDQRPHVWLARGSHGPGHTLQAGARATTCGKSSSWNKCTRRPVRELLSPGLRTSWCQGQADAHL